MKTRRVRARTTTADYDDVEEKPAKPAPADGDGFEDEADDTPEVDEVAAEPIEGDDAEDDGAGAPASPDDLGVDFAEDEELEEEADDDVPFLEDEDDDNFEDEIEGLPSEDND